MKSALHQNARAAKRNGLIYLLANFVNRADVSFRVSRSAIKRAEGADDVADVRIVDIAINDVGDDAFRIKAFANLIGGKTDADEIVRLKKLCAILNAQALAGERTIKNRLNVG